MTRSSSVAVAIALVAWFANRRSACSRRGIGRSLLLGLTAGRHEHTAALSTQDDNSPARRLYHSVGFADLLTGFSFPGGGPPYTVMGAVLPLRPAAQGSAAPDGGG